MFPLEEGFGEPWFPMSVPLSLVFRGWGRCAALGFRSARGAFGGAVGKPVAASGDRDDFGVMKQAVQDGAGGGHIVEQLAPLLDGPVGCHKRGSVFVASHDDLQQYFAAFCREHFEPHVVDDEQVGFEVFGHQATLPRMGLLKAEFAHQLEDGAVEDDAARFDGFGSDGLRQVAFAHSGWADQ